MSQTVNSPTRLMIIRFDRKISGNDIPKFRGAVIASMGKAPVQFHNHTDEGVVYSYPLVQYKRVQGDAAIICIGDGIKNIGEFLTNFHPGIKLGDKDTELHIKDISVSDVNIYPTENRIMYTLTNWLPFNQNNYEEFLSLESLSQKCGMLERILTGNILSFAKGLGVFFDFTIDCSITGIGQSKIKIFKNVKMMAFNVAFKCNVNFPEWIGLGKGVSHGFGVLNKS